MLYGADSATLAAWNLALIARNVQPISRYGLLARPGNGPSGHDQTGQRVFAVAIVLSLFT